MHMSSCGMRSRHAIVFVYSYTSWFVGASLQRSRVNPKGQRRSRTRWWRRCLVDSCRAKSGALHALQNPISLMRSWISALTLSAWILWRRLSVGFSSQKYWMVITNTDVISKISPHFFVKFVDLTSILQFSPSIRVWYCTALLTLLLTCSTPCNLAIFQQMNEDTLTWRLDGDFTEGISQWNLSSDCLSNSLVYSLTSAIMVMLPE